MNRTSLYQYTLIHPIFMTYTFEYVAKTVRAEGERSFTVQFTKTYYFLIVVIGIASFISIYKLPYYIYKPGGADALNPIVEVESGHKSEGDMHLVTIRGGQATPVQYLLAKFCPIRKCIHLIKSGRREYLKMNTSMHSCR